MMFLKTMPKAWVVIFLVLCNYLPAQNLVPNGGFESYSTCPTGFSHFDGYVGNWNNPNAASPDYYNACAGNNPATVPNNPTGYQAAHNGQAYAGIFTTAQSYREFLQVQLTNPLTAGVTYNFSMYVSLANTAHVAVDDIGAYISSSAPTSFSPGMLNGSPQAQISSPAGVTLTDTLGWTLIAGTYVAGGGERFITIGHFKPDAQTAYTNLPYGTIGAYYFVDDVKLESNCCTDSVTFSNLTQPSCGLANGGLSAALYSACSGNAVAYNWSTGSHSATINNIAAGPYSVTITDNNNCTVGSTIDVAPAGVIPAITTGQYPSTCGNNNGTATAAVVSGIGPYTYHWSNGEDGDMVGGLAAADYSVTVTGNAGCSASATVTVGNSGSAPGLSTSSINAGCGNSNGSISVTVVSGAGPFTYAWSNGDDSTTAVNLSPGSYGITVSDGFGCATNITVSIINTGTLPALTTSSTMASCTAVNGTATVTVNGSGSPFGYTWSNGSHNATATGLGAGTYTVTVTTANNCSATASATVNAAGAISAAIASENTSCGLFNGTATAYVTGGSGSYNYLWSNGETTAVVDSLPPGPYSVTVTDVSGCDAQVGVTIGPSDAIILPIATANTYQMCSGDSAHICAQGGYNTYLWNTGETTECIFTHLAGNYYLTVTDNNGCSAASNRAEISTFPRPPVTVSVNGDTLRSFGAQTYQWLYENQPIPGATEPVYVVTQTGHYALAITDTNGCGSKSLAVLITVTNTGITLINSAHVKIYPNPSATGNWHLAVTPNLLNTQAEVFDIAGRLVYTFAINELQSQISFNAPQGVYLLQINSGNVKYNTRLIKM